MINRNAHDIGFIIQRQVYYSIFEISAKNYQAFQKKSWALWQLFSIPCTPGLAAQLHDCHLDMTYNSRSLFTSLMENAMKIRTLLQLACFVLPATLSATPYDHIHLAADNAFEAAQWYAKHFGGTPTRFRDSSDTSLPIDRVKMGDIYVIFYERDPGEGSVGSGVDHIGFSLPNLAEVFGAAVADGGTALGELRAFNGMALGFIEDPWGTKIELIDDAELRGAHHIHLSTPDPAATLAWYQDTFKGESAQFGGALPGVHFGNIWVLAAQVQGEIAPTIGRSMDHLGWSFPDLDAAAVEMKAKGVVFSAEPRDFRGIRISFVEGPDGVRIEVVQP